MLNTSFEYQNQQLIQKIGLYPLLYNFWKETYFVDNLILPQNYPTLENILSFQDGYAYNSVENKSLIGNQEGDFKASWLVIASNYFADPFFIDFNEAEENFPVYFAFHGEGGWKPIKVSNSIETFQEIIKTISEYQFSKKKNVSYLKELKNLGNEFWEEVYENEISTDEIIEEIQPMDEADWRNVEIYITEIGPNKMKIVSLLKEKYRLTGAEALEMSKSSRIFYAKGPFKFMKASMQQLENFGASFELVGL